MFVSLAAFVFVSCANVRSADQADGLLDYVMILTGKAKPDIAKIEQATTGGGEVSTARAFAFRGGTLVRGSVTKAGAGWVSSAYSHIDLLLLNERRQVIDSETTRFVPSVIPNRIRGIEGRSYYSAIFATLPAPDSIIRVLFHNVPLKQCANYRPARPIARKENSVRVGLFCNLRDPVCDSRPSHRRKHSSNEKSLRLSIPFASSPVLRFL